MIFLEQWGLNTAGKIILFNIAFPCIAFMVTASQAGARNAHSRIGVCHGDVTQQGFYASALGEDGVFYNDAFSGLAQVYKQWAFTIATRNSDTEYVPVTFLLEFPDTCFPVLLTDSSGRGNDASIHVCISTSKNKFFWNEYYPADPNINSQSDHFYYFASGN